MGSVSPFAKQLSENGQRVPTRRTVFGEWGARPHSQNGLRGMGSASSFAERFSESGERVLQRIVFFVFMCFFLVFIILNVIKMYL